MRVACVRSVLAAFVVIVIGVTLRAAPTFENDPFEGAPEAVRQWLARRWTADAVTEGIALVEERTVPPRFRLLVLDRLHGRRRAMGAHELASLANAVRRIAADASHPVPLRARAVAAIAATAIVRQEQNRDAQAGTQRELALLATLSRDGEQPSAVRGGAVRALSILGSTETLAIAKSLLATNIDDPEIARNACLALARVKNDAAVAAIVEVLATTRDAAIFGTAAFSLGQMHTEAAVVALVQHQSRFPQSASPDAVLVDMEHVILRMLERTTEPDRRYAVLATRHLWKDGQRERYTPLLRRIVADAPLATRQAAIDRLLQDASALPFEEEQRQLAILASDLDDDPALAAQRERIDMRRRATLVSGQQSTAIPPSSDVTTDLGNTAAQEYGDAVYRRLGFASAFGYNYNHAGLYAGQSSGVKRVIEADTLTGDTTKDNTFSGSFTSHGSDYYGAFQLSNKTLTFSQRKAIMATARQLADAYIAYTFANALDPLTSTRPVAISNIDNIRCDGVVEYAYESNSQQSWWNTGNTSRWNITQYPEEHNNAPDITVNPGTEMSPWAQRGAPASSSEGPGFSGTNPQNAYLKKSASIAMPTYQTSQVRVNNASIDYTITARDESGIAYISYKTPGSTTWQQTSYGPQHPSSDSTSTTVRVTSTGTLSYYASDNGGNQIQATSAPSISFYSISSSAGTGGSISPSGTYLVAAGGSGSYTAYPNSGYEVHQWLLGGSAVQNGGTTYTVTNVQANRTLQVTFRAVTRVIRLSGDLAFGSVTVGQTSTRTLTIYNDGNSALSVSSITYPTAFSGNWGSGTISAGGSQNVTVTFAPTSATSYGGTVTVNSNKTSGTNTTSCSGTGAATPTRIIRLGGDLSFGNVAVGQTANRTLTIYNDGNSTMTVSSISYPPGFSGNWGGGTISAGNSRNVTVTFAPSSATAYGGTVTVQADQTSGTNSTSCSGTGVLTPTRIIRLEGDLAFGGVGVGQTSTRTLTIFNDGNSTLTVASISYPTGFSGDWSGGSIGAGDSHAVNVTFAPSAATNYGGTITVASDKTSGPNTTSCSGTGVGATCLPLTTNVDPPAGGSITINTSPNCGGGYNAGTPIQLTASAMPGYTFSGWVGSGGAFSSTSATQTTFTIASTATVTATFGGSTNPVPNITSVSPVAVTAGGSGFTLTVDGTGFLASSTVHWNGSSRQTTYVSSTRLTALITASDIASPGTATITVVNPSPGGGTSNTATVTIQQQTSQCTPVPAPACPFSVARSITTSSCTTGVRTGHYTDVLSFAGTQGGSVVINMDSDFDTFLYLLAPDGTLAAFNDDANGTTNSQITATLTVTGTWTVQATTYYAGVTGAYQLSMGGCGQPLSTPTGVLATYNPALVDPNTPGVDVRWNSVPGAVAYDADVNGYVLNLQTAATTAGFYGLAEPVCYTVRIRAVGAAGELSAWSNRDIATSIVFSDDPLIARQTLIRARHFTELRNAVATVRSAAGRPVFSFQDAMVAGIRPRAIHATELRDALNDALTALGLTNVSFASPVTGGAVVVGSDLQRLRDAMK